MKSIKRMLSVFAIAWLITGIALLSAVSAADLDNLIINNQTITQISITGDNDGISSLNNSYQITAKDKESSGCGGKEYSGQTHTLTFTNNYGGYIKLTYTITDGTLAAKSNCTIADGVITVQSGGTFTIAVTSSSNRNEPTQGSKTCTFSPTAIEYEPLTPEISFAAPIENGTFTVKDADGNAVTVPSTATSSSYTLTAAPATGYEVFRWKFTSSSGAVTYFGENASTYPYLAYEAGTITCEFMQSGSAIYSVNDVKYTYLDNAITAAGSNGTVVVYQSGTAYHSDSSKNSFTITDGVTLLIPFDSANTLVTNGTGNLMDSYGNITRSQYRALTMPSDSKITVASGGKISIGSQRANQFLGQVGPYGAIIMESGSNITVQSGGFLYAWGYVFHGNTGSGTVTVESGGTVYEPMSIMDYPGSSSATTSLTDDPVKVFPMRSYSVRNVEVPMTLHSGAKEYVFTCLYGSNFLVGTNPLYVLLIADKTTGNETPVLQNTGTITKSYSNGRMRVEIDGDFTLNSLTVKVSKSTGTYTISSSATTGFYIPSCWDMTIVNGTTTINDNVIICQGSRITINRGATINANGKSFYVLDADNDPDAVGNVAGLGATTVGGGYNGCSIDVQDVHGNYYTYVPSDAVLDINGTLIASGGFYTSNAGACITSSEGGGVIQISGTSTSTSVNVKNTNSYTSVNINAAWLKNANGTYVSSTLSSAFIYDLPTGRWLCYDADNKTYAHHDTTGYCTDCGAYLGEESALSKFYATNVNLGNNLDMLFAFPKNANASYAVFTREGHDPIIVEIDTTKTIKIGTVECYYVSYSGFAAKEMCDTVYVHLYDSSNNRITECKNDGIRKYAMRMLEKLASEDDEASKYLKRVIVDMLDYGTACQTYFGYKTTDMANKDLTDVQRAYTSETLPTVTGTTIANSYWNGSNLITSSNIQLAMAFKNVTGEMYVQFSYKGHKGNSVTSEKLYPQNTADGYITVPELVVADSRCPVTVTVYNADGTVVASWTESIESYVGRNAADDPVFLAFMKFSDSAKVYLHNKNS